ncbi:MAG: alcohol dehydrogenase catalytic domain-containing protein [Omnitrophica WOR_2 bacterium]
MKNMRIARLTAPQQFEIIDNPIPEPGPDEVLVRVTACGVCTSELEQWEHRVKGLEYPRFIGHEVSGVVVETGRDVSNIKPGDQVAVWTLSHGYAEYVTEKAEYCFPVENVPLELALGEPISCAVNAIEQANLSLSDDVVLIGAGFMGNLVQKLVQLQGPRQVIVADIRMDALNRAKALGATCVVNIHHEHLPEIVKSLTGGAGADASFEISGGQEPLQMCGDVTRMGGKVVVVGYHSSGMREIPLGYWNWMAFQIVNAHFRDMATILRGMRIGMRLLASGRLHLDGLVTHYFPLKDINDAFRTAMNKPEGFVKAIITF